MELFEFLLFLLFLLFFIALFFIFSYVSNIIYSVNMERELRGMAETYIDNLPTATVQKHGSTLYLFMDKNNKFLGQAKTIDDLAVECWEIFDEPVVKVNMDNKEYYFTAGEVMEEPEISIEIKDKK